MLKNIFTTIVLNFLVIITSTVQGQDKPRLYIDAFQVASGISDNDAANIRAAILEAVEKTHRFELVTADAEQAIKNEIKRRSSEEAMHDETVRKQIIMAVGCDYVMTGKIMKCDTEKHRSPNISHYNYDIVTETKTMYDPNGRSHPVITTSIKKNRVQTNNESYYYSCAMSYSLTITKIQTSTTIASKEFNSNSGKHRNTGISPEKAIANANYFIEEDVEDFIIEYFPLEGNIIPIDYELKNNRMLSCYINLGSEQRVKAGDIFIVYEPKIIIGNITYSEIGQVKIEEVVSDIISRCKVTKGHKKLYSAMENLTALDEDSQKRTPIKVKIKTSK